MSDSEVAGILRRLKKFADEDTGREAEKKLLWGRLYELADDAVGEGVEFVYVDPELKESIGRTVAQGAARLDQKTLRLGLNDEEWKLVTIQTRVFDLEKLELAVAGGKIDRAVVQGATTTPPPSLRKSGPKAATKAQLEELAIAAAAAGGE
jgi:hypothetical protein